MPGKKPAPSVQPEKKAAPVLAPDPTLAPVPGYEPMRGADRLMSSPLFSLPASPLLGSQRQALAARVGRVHGNQHLQRALAQREGTPGAVSADAPAPARVGIANKGSIPISFDVPLKIPLDYAEIKKATITGELEFEVANEGQAEAEAPGTPSSVKVGGGVSAKNGKPGISAEVEKTWEDLFAKSLTGMTPKTKIGAEGNAEEASLGIEGQLEGENLAWSLGFKLAQYEKGEVEFGVMVMGAEWKKDMSKSFELGEGVTAKTTIKPKVELTVQPEYGKIVEQLAKEAAIDIGIEAAITGGFILGGLMSIVGVVEALIIADDLENAIKSTSDYVSNFSGSFSFYMHGRTQPAPQPGGAEGWTAAQQFVEAQSKKIPRALLLEKAKDQEYFWKTANEISGKVKQHALDAWKDNHWFDMNLNGAKGYRTLEMAFEGLLYSEPK